jgi:predicted transcriptional regulator
MAKWEGITDSELAILALLWERGPSTVRDVFDNLPPERQKGYTTTLKLMQLMHEKGLLKRDEQGRAHVYSPTEEAERRRSGIVRDLVGRLFGGSKRALVMSALGPDYDANQLAEIDRLLAEPEASQ